MTGFPCLTGKSSKKRLFRLLLRPKMTLQAIDSFESNPKFPYAAEQRNFGG
jgi:hypothetical protein